MYIVTYQNNKSKISTLLPVVGEVPTKRSSDHDPIIRHCSDDRNFSTLESIMWDDRFKTSFRDRQCRFIA